MHTWHAMLPVTNNICKRRHTLTLPINNAEWMAVFNKPLSCWQVCLTKRYTLLKGLHIIRVIRWQSLCLVWSVITFCIVFVLMSKIKYSSIPQQLAEKLCLGWGQPSLLTTRKSSHAICSLFSVDETASQKIILLCGEFFQIKAGFRHKKIMYMTRKHELRDIFVLLLQFHSNVQ